MIDTPDYNKKDNQKVSLSKFKKILGTKIETKFLYWLIYVVLLCFGGGLSYGWYFVSQKLSPLVETKLSKFLNRPVEIGEVEYVSLTGVRFANSEIPVTKTDKDFAIVEAVDVKFNPIKLLTQKTLELDLTLIQPYIYIEEDKSKTWIQTRLNRSNSESDGISIKLQSINLDNSNLTLQPLSKINNNLPSVKVKVNDASVHFYPQTINFQVGGKSLQGGEINVDGVYEKSTKQVDLLIDGEDILSDEISNLVPLPLDLNSGDIDGDLAINLGVNQKAKISGEATFNQVNLDIPNLSKNLTRTTGKIFFHPNGVQINNSQTNFGLISAANVNGLINYKGTIELTGETQPIEVSNVIKSLNLPQPSLPILGKVKADLAITGALKKPKLITHFSTVNQAQLDKVKLDFATGNLELFNSNLTVTDLRLFPEIGGQVISQGKVNLDDNNPQFLFTINADNISSEKLALVYQQDLPIELGRASGKYNLLGSWKQLNSSQLMGITKVKLADGEAIISDLKGDRENWQANLTLSNINFAKLTHNSSSICENLNCQNSQLNGNFQVSGNSKEIKSTTVKAQGNAKVNLAGNIISLENVYLNQGDWQTNIKTNQLELATISADSQTKLRGKINSNLKVEGNLENSTAVITDGNGKLTLAEGDVNFNGFKLNNDNQFFTQLTSSSFDLNTFSSQLRGKANGNLQVTGNINNLNANELKISGDVGLNKGIGLIKQPLQTSFHWNGENLFIKEANVNGIKATGVVAINVENQEVENFNLDVSSQNVNLKSLSSFLPSQLQSINYQGNFDFAGKVFGDLEKPNLVGNIALNNFSTTGFDFNPLVGKIEAKHNQDIQLSLTEKDNQGDLINVSLNPQYQPEKINIKVEDTYIVGEKENETFAVSLIDIPVKKLSSPQMNLIPSNISNIDGQLSAKLNINLNNYDVTDSQIVIENPVVANFEGDLLTAKVEYTQDNLNFYQGNIVKNNNNYQFQANISNLENNPQVEGQLAVEKQDIQELLKDFEIFNLDDFQRGLKSPEYATAKDLYTDKQKENLEGESNSLPVLISVGDSEMSFENQLENFNEISELVEEREEEKLNAPIPELKELKGDFEGVLNVNGSIKEGLNTEFNFQGENWQWGRYQADLVQIKGNYKDDVLTFLPIQIKQDDTVFALLGSFNKERLQGQIRVKNLPIDEVQKIVASDKLIGFGGMLNANIAISGSEESPLAKGEINIDDATVNGSEIKSNKASFNYKNSRVDFFASSILQEDIDPLTIKGSFPYQLFPNSIPPNSESFDVSLNVEEDVFPILNSLTVDEVKLLAGRGNINLDIKGKYNQERHQFREIETNGIATLENGIIEAKVFPDKPLTDINGKLLFDFDKIKVDSFAGNFSGGKIAIAGNLPLIEDKNINNNPLAVNFNDLAVDVEDLYKGKIKGDLLITGSAIKPKLSGDLELFNGKISLKQDSKNKPIDNENQAILANTKFEDLNLILGRNIEIKKAPILSVMATGNLSLNGSINEPQPTGNVYLTEGRVNLFTSRLRLDEGHKNIAKFTTENGLDPFLDIQLLASVSESNRHQFVNSPIASEIDDLSNSEVGRIKTIQVEASVKGLSSQLTDKLELTSSPQRSESEIIALLGGGFFNNFSEGNSNLGLANLASAAVLGSFQGEIGDALGLSEFRLFPTQVIDSENRTSTLNLGAEIGLDISDDFSVSVVKILTNEQAPQYSIRYRVNDQTLVRASSDFDDDSRGSIEFEQRF